MLRIVIFLGKGIGLLMHPITITFRGMTPVFPGMTPVFPDRRERVPAGHRLTGSDRLDPVGLESWRLRCSGCRHFDTSVLPAGPAALAFVPVSADANIGSYSRPFRAPLRCFYQDSDERPKTIDGGYHQDILAGYHARRSAATSGSPWPTSPTRCAIRLPNPWTFQGFPATRWPETNFAFRHFGTPPPPGL